MVKNTMKQNWNRMGKEWNKLEWDGINQNGMERIRMGWNELEWDGMNQNGME